LKDILQEQEQEDEEEEDNYDCITAEQRPIPPSFIQDEIFVSNALPVPATSTPVLPPPIKRLQSSPGDKQARCVVCLHFEQLYMVY
jgi:hypothetical protein